MAKLAPIYPLAEDICESLGIDPMNVIAVDAYARVGKIETVTVTLSDPVDLSTHIRKFHLIPIPTDGGGNVTHKTPATYSHGSVITTRQWSRLPWGWKQRIPYWVCRFESWRRSLRNART